MLYRKTKKNKKNYAKRLTLKIECTTIENEKFNYRKDLVFMAEAEFKNLIQGMIDKISGMDAKFDKFNKEMVTKNPLLAKNLEVADSKKMWSGTFDNFYGPYSEFVITVGEKFDVNSDGIPHEILSGMSNGIDAISGKYQKYKDYFEYTLNVSKVKKLLEDLGNGVGHSKLD